jgi:hypothetical protein
MGLSSAFAVLPSPVLASGSRPPSAVIVMKSFRLGFNRAIRLRQAVVSSTGKMSFSALVGRLYRGQGSRRRWMLLPG